MDILSAVAPQPTDSTPADILFEVGPDSPFEQAQAKVRTSAGANPDQAAQSITIGDQVGVPPQVVHQDFDNFSKLHETGTAGAIVAQNPHLQKYVNSHPLAAAVSKDDWPQMDAAAKATAKVGGPSILSAAIQGFKENYNAAEGDAEFQRYKDWLASNPLFGNDFIRMAAEAGGAALDVSQRLFSGVIGGAAKGIEQTYISAGGNPSWGARLTRDLIIAANVGLAEPMAKFTGPVHPEVAATIDEMSRQARAVAPYVHAGEEPPIGLHPDIDAAKADQAKIDADNLSDALKEATKSATRKRSPDLYAGMIRGITDGNIGVSADAVRALYGDKVPMPDDGLLGWVPRISDQLETAEATGGDISIPIADWLAKVEPEVAKQLESFVRARDGGVTLEEAKTLPKVEPTGDLLTDIRVAHGMNELPQVKKPEQLELPQAGTTRVEDREVFASANAIGMTVDQYKRYQRLIEKRRQEDADAARAAAVEMERKRQTTEWKENRRTMRAEVVNDIADRPDHALDEMLREGKVKLGSDYLSENQKAALPKEWIGRDGANPDDLAGLFGADTGRGVVDSLIALKQARDASGMRPMDFRRRVIDVETDRRMEAQYGNLERNILEEAKDQVLSETQVNLLHEETLALAEQAGAEFSISKGQMQAWVNKAFDKLPIGEITSKRFLDDAGRAGRNAELALLKGDPAEAFRQKQRQYIATVMSKRALRYEKARRTFDNTAKRMAQREVPTIEQEYTNWVHDILVRVGMPIKRSVQDLAETIGRGEQKSLEEFVDYKQGHDMREVPVAEFLLDPNFRKPMDQLTAQEFDALHDSIKTLVKNGRDEKKILKAGEEADLAEIKAQMILQLATFKEKHYDASGNRPLGPLPPRVGRSARTYLVSHLQLETVLRRWDRADPRGVFSQFVSRELATSANGEAALERTIATKLKAISDKVDLKERVPNPIFLDPMSYQKPISGVGPETGTLIQMTRKNLRAILLNVGNASNLDKLSRGYKVAPETIMQWLNTYAKKEDWDFAQKVGKLFGEELKPRADVMYRSLSGLEPENIPLDKIQTPFGEVPGWYYPVIYHPVWEGMSKKLMGPNALEENNYVRATVPAGYTKSRTGYAAPMALDLDMLPFRIRQMIHDISFRPAIIQASKIFYDSGVRAAVAKHFGVEYRDMLIPYLKDVANNANYRSPAQVVGNRFLEFMRQNMITTLVGLNPGTVMKHGPTAWVNSMTEVGPKNFLNATLSLLSKNDYTSESNWQFAMKTSEELQRRVRFYTETLGGAHDEIMQAGKFRSLRETLIKLGSTPVAFSDLLSAVPTWMAKYKAEMDEHGVHGDAVYAADTAVRRAHGSSVVTNRPEIMRRPGSFQWLTSLYGFFNHIMNRQVEMVWQAGDTLKLAKSGDFAGAAKNIPELAAGLFSYVIFPAAVEELVSPLATDKHESFGEIAAKSLLYTLSSSWIGVRDLVSALVAGRDPSAGLISTAYKTMSDVVRDVKKDRPFNRQHAGNILKHGSTAIGAVTGLTNAQEGRTAKFIYEYATGLQHPHTLPEWYHGMRYGTTRPRR